MSADAKRAKELEKICKEQAAKIELLNSLVPFLYFCFVQY